MIYNTSGPLNPRTHKQIIMEREELAKALSLIKDSDYYVAMSGPRQFGKTTMLYQMQNILPAQKYGMSYLDLENAGDYDKSKFYNVVTRNIWNSLCNILDDVHENYNLEKVVDQDKFIEFLLYLSEHTSNLRKLIIFIDEIGGIPYDIAWKSFLPSLRWIFTAGRGGSKEARLCNRLRFVFAGSTDLLQYVGLNSPINNVCERIEVREFNENQVVQLARKLRMFNTEQQNEIAQIVYTWTDGHPYLTQKVLSIVEEHHLEIVDGKAPKLLDDLIEANILVSRDKNISHIINILEEKPEYLAILSPIYVGKTKKDIQYKDELITTGLLKVDKKTHFLKPRNKIYLQAVKSLLNVHPVSAQSSLDQKPKLIIALLRVISAPKYIGEIVLETFGRTSSLSTKITWGYFILLVLLLIIGGVVDFEQVKLWFITFWRFFFPLK